MSSPLMPGPSPLPGSPPLRRHACGIPHRRPSPRRRTAPAARSPRLLPQTGHAASSTCHTDWCHRCVPVRPPAACRSPSAASAQDHSTSRGWADSARRSGGQDAGGANRARREPARPHSSCRRGTGPECECPGCPAGGGVQQAEEETACASSTRRWLGQGRRDLPPMIQLDGQGRAARARRSLVAVAWCLSLCSPHLRICCLSLSLLPLSRAAHPARSAPTLRPAPCMTGSATSTDRKKRPCPHPMRSHLGERRRVGAKTKPSLRTSSSASQSIVT